jgi:hypothetical protein
MAFSPCCLLAVDHAQRTVVLSVRGTACAGDTLTDCCAEPVPFLGGHAHAGIVAATWQLVAAFVPRLAAALVSEALAVLASWRCVHACKTAQARASCGGHREAAHSLTTAVSWGATTLAGDARGLHKSGDGPQHGRRVCGAAGDAAAQ